MYYIPFSTIFAAKSENTAHKFFCAVLKIYPNGSIRIIFPGIFKEKDCSRTAARISHISARPSTVHSLTPELVIRKTPGPRHRAHTIYHTGKSAASILDRRARKAQSPKRRHNKRNTRRHSRTSRLFPCAIYCIRAISGR